MSAAGHQLLLLGEGQWVRRVAGTLIEDGLWLTVGSAPSAPPGCYDLLVLQLADTATVAEWGALARRLAVPWIACASVQDSAILTTAYAAGALAALPAEASAIVIRQAIDRALSLAGGGRRQRTREASYAAGSPIPLQDDSVLTVVQGVIAQYALHEDGAEVLLGLWGAGEHVPGHPSDACCLEIRAHTEATVRLRSWREARADPDLVAGFRRRLCRMEAWSSMQARPSMEQRLSGILSLLAEQFGVPDGPGTRIELRLTHVQLASAIGANRATVTRLLGSLRRRGEVSTVGCHAQERFLWRGHELGNHRARSTLLV
jgi:hypothetical protein